MVYPVGGRSLQGRPVSMKEVWSPWKRRALPEGPGTAVTRAQSRGLFRA